MALVELMDRPEGDAGAAKVAQEESKERTRKGTKKEGRRQPHKERGMRAPSRRRRSGNDPKPPVPEPFSTVRFKRQSRHKRRRYSYVWLESADISETRTDTRLDVR